MQSEFYEKNLYPLQDGVLNIVERCDTRFYLTGGTALSRAYYHHRYSDDLDFFVSSDDDYTEQVKLVIACLEENGFIMKQGPSFIKNISFWSGYIHKEGIDAELKLDFVNDLVPHFGEIVSTDFYYRVDPVRNILSNKLSAVFRFAAKDVADIREIALHENVNWSDAIGEACEKDAGAEISAIAYVLQNMPQSAYAGINWVREPGWETFRADIERIVESMLRA